MSVSFRRLYVGASVAVIVAACGESTSPVIPAFKGTWVLRTVGDSTVPFTTLSAPGLQLRQVADTMVVDGAGNANFVDVVSQVQTGSPTQTFVSQYTYGYTQRGDSVYFSVPCSPGDMCAPPPQGWFTASGRFQMRIRYDSTTVSATKTFEKVAG